MAIGNLNVGNFKIVSATGNVNPNGGALLGIFVSSASGSPTITIYDSATTTTTDPIVSVFTPVAATWYPIPAVYKNGLYVVIAATVGCTVIFA